MEHDVVKAMDHMNELVDKYLPALCKELLQFEDGQGKGVCMYYCEQRLTEANIGSYNAQVIVQNTIKHAAIKKIVQEFGE